MSARQVELVIRREGHPERRMALAPGAVVVGRAEDNDVVLSEIGVSRRHARIVVEEEGIFVEDMGSGNGTWYRGERVTRQLVADGDEVLIDPFSLGFHVAGGDATAEVTAGGDATVLVGGLPVASARLEILSPHPMPQRVLEIPAGASRSFGRSEKADVVLPEPVASRLHCDIGETAGSWWIRDRDSANGTYVNGVRVREKVLADGDRIRIGSFEMRFVGPPPLLLEETGDHTEAFDAVMFTAALPEAFAAAPNIAAPRPAPVPPPPTLAPAPPVPPPPTLAPPPAAEPRPALAGLSASPTLIREPAAPIPPPPTLPKPAAAPRAAPVPPPPTLPFAPRPTPMARPAPATLPPAAASTGPAAAPGVEIDFDVDKVKAKKGPKGRAGRRDAGFLSRPINQISLGILMLAGLMVGGRMVYDMGQSILAARGGAEEPEAEAPTGASTPTAALPTPTLAAATPVAATPAAAPAAPAAPVAATPSAAPAATLPAGAALPAPAAVAPSARAPLDPAKREEVAALMAEGMRLFTEGKQFEAATQFYKVQQLDPGNPDAERMGYVACEFIAMQKMFEGLQARSASEAERATAKSTALTTVAAALDDGSQVPAATQALAAALALLPGDAELVAAQEQLEARRGAIARGAAVRKEQAKQASLAEMVAAGQREMDRGNLVKAVGQWQAVLDADPSRASPQYYQAEEGIRTAKDKMKADSKKAYAAGLAAYKDGDLLTARAQLGQTVRVDPYNEAAASKLAEVRKRLKEQASEIYKEARVLEDINQVDKALGLYQKVLTYVDDAGDPLANKAQGRINALLQ